MAKSPAAKLRTGKGDAAKTAAYDEPAGTDEGDGANKADKQDSKGGEDLITLAREIYEAGFNRDRDNQDEAYKDLKFIAGDPEVHWDPKASQERTDEDRPALVVNQCPQFVRQVTGDMRQMRPSIKVVPIDDAANKDVAAKVLPGLIRYIESRSDAKGIYFAAADQQVGCGIGGWMVVNEYASARTFNQELRIAPIPDAIAVVWDADAILPTREDATDCFVPYDMSTRVFKKKHPNASSDPLTSASECWSNWISDDHVRVAIWFHKVPEKKRLALYEDGRIDDVTDDEEAEAEAVALGAEVKERDGFKVERYLISANEVIEGPETVPGPNIPVVPLIGEEVVIGRRVVRRGVVRVLRDVQRIFNYAISTQTEVIALQPKSPFIGTQKQFEKHTDQWETANTRNWPFLEYTPEPGVPPPQRANPPVASSGLDDLMTKMQEAMHSTTGIYPSALGAKSNETSGKAIMARQREGDTGTYVYNDNLSRALCRTGQIIVDMAPDIYDTKRTIQIVGEDGKIDSLEINQAELGPDAEAHIALNDITKGAYLVAVEMGPSFSTKREEAREGMIELMRTLGPAGMLIADLYAKQQDFPLADKIAERLKTQLPPAIVAREAAEAGEQPPPPPPPPPPTPEQQEMMREEQQKNLELARKNELDERNQALELRKIAQQDRELDLQARGQAVETVGMASQELNAARDHELAINPPPEPAPAAKGKGAVDAEQTQDIDDLKQHIAEMTEVLMALGQQVDALSGAGQPDINPMDGLEMGGTPAEPLPAMTMDPGTAAVMGEPPPPVG